MEKFSVSVNIASNSKVTFILTHEELLQRTLGQYEILTRVKPKEPVQEFKVNSCSTQKRHSKWIAYFINVLFFLKIVTNIYEPQGISYVDAHATFLTNDLLPLVEKTVTDKKVFYVHTQTALSFVPLHFFLNMIWCLLSGAHQLLANYGTAEEVSRLPWNTY